MDSKSDIGIYPTAFAFTLSDFEIISQSPCIYIQWTVSWKRCKTSSYDIGGGIAGGGGRGITFIGINTLDQFRPPPGKISFRRLCKHEPFDTSSFDFIGNLERSND